MKVLSQQILLWLMSLTTLMRYFVIAIMFHVLILFILATLKMAAQIPAIPVIFRPVAEPPPRVETGDSGGSAGIGSVGLKPASGPIPAAYKPNMSAVTVTAVGSQFQPVIGLDSDSAIAVARLQSSVLSSVSAPPAGFDESKFGTSVGPGPGGDGYRHRDRAKIEQTVVTRGGTPETERAVLAALRWLQEQQTTDGSWAGSQRDAISALATLCFLGHGEDPDSKEFGPTVTRALSYLVTTVGSDGIVKSKNMYSQGAVLLALAEAYGMTRSYLVRDPLERAVNAVVQSQKVKKTKPADQGGWRYSPVATDADTSVTGWLVMGLKSAKLAGITVPDEAFTKASEYFWNMQAENGGFGYAGKGNGVATTAIGILCQQFLGHQGDRRLKKALDLYKDKKMDWDNPPANHGTSLYAWYYITQALFQSGGSYWTQWNTDMRSTLVKRQATDGHWDAPGSEKNKFGPVYSTALCCLMLEVYYRYLPIYLEMEKKEGGLRNSPPSS